MYRVSTRDARTDLYGVGKGAAQVVDLSPTRQAAAQEQERNFKSQEAQKGREDSKEQGIYDKLGKLDTKQIYQRDQPLFAKMKEEFYAQTKKDIQKLKKGDSEAWIRFHSGYGNIVQEAELSSNTRAQIQKLTYGKNFDDIDEEDLAGLEAIMNTPGDYGVDKINLSPKVTWGGAVNDLVGVANKMADDYTGYGKKFGLEEAEHLIDGKLEDKAYARQALRDFDAASDEELSELGLSRGETTPAQYIKKKYAKDLIYSDKAKPAASGGEGPDKKIPRTNWTKRADGTITYDISKNYKQSQPVTFQDPKNPRTATSAGRSITVKPLEIIADGKGGYKLLATHTSGDSETKGTNVLLDYDEVQKWMYRNFDIVNPQEYFNEVEAGEKPGKGYNLTTNQSSAMSAFEKKYKRKPTETEKAAILKKYK